MHVCTLFVCLFVCMYYICIYVCSIYSCIYLCVHLGMYVNMPRCRWEDRS